MWKVNACIWFVVVFFECIERELLLLLLLLMFMQYSMHKHILNVVLALCFCVIFFGLRCSFKSWECLPANTHTHTIQYMAKCTHGKWIFQIVKNLEMLWDTRRKNQLLHCNATMPQLHKGILTSRENTREKCISRTKISSWQKKCRILNVNMLIKIDLRLENLITEPGACACTVHVWQNCIYNSIPQTSRKRNQVKHLNAILILFPFCRCISSQNANEYLRNWIIFATGCNHQSNYSAIFFDNRQSFMCLMKRSRI